jgi:hypothetical protein
MGELWSVLGLTKPFSKRCQSAGQRNALPFVEAKYFHKSWQLASFFDHSNPIQTCFLK